MHMVELVGLNILKTLMAEKIKFIDLTGDCALALMYLLKLREANENNKKHRPDTAARCCRALGAFRFRYSRSRRDSIRPVINREEQDA